jgi:hypothetical protein
MFSILFAPRRNKIKSERGVRVSNIGYQIVNIEGRMTGKDAAAVSAVISKRALARARNEEKG